MSQNKKNSAQRKKNSVRARGAAASARERGAKNNVKGFEKPPGKGKEGGPKRQQCNDIVHAESGQAGQHVELAEALYEEAFGS